MFFDFKRKKEKQQCDVMLSARFRIKHLTTTLCGKRTLFLNKNTQITSNIGCMHKYI